MSSTTFDKNLEKSTLDKDHAESGERVYILYYHYRYQRPLELIFKMKGALKEAIERGRKHCERMDYRFIKVRPFVVDLDERENRKLNDPYYSEDT